MYVRCECMCVYSSFAERGVALANRRQVMATNKSAVDGINPADDFPPVRPSITTSLTLSTILFTAFSNHTLLPTIDLVSMPHLLAL